MKKELAKPNEAISNIQNFTTEQIELIKTTVCKGSTNEELKLFLNYAQRTGLDPFSKQLHAVKRKNNKTGVEEMSIQTGIDGYRLVAQRTGLHAGTEDAIFEEKFSTTGNQPPVASPIKASVTVYKMISGIRVPFTASARYSEYVQTVAYGKPNSMWTKMPYSQLAKCAEALALRKAFPMELSGIYTHDEMAQADNDTPDQNTKEIETIKPLERKPKEVEEKVNEKVIEATAEDVNTEVDDFGLSIDKEVLAPMSSTEWTSIESKVDELAKISKKKSYEIIMFLQEKYGNKLAWTTDTAKEILLKIDNNIAKHKIETE